MPNAAISSISSGGTPFSKPRTRSRDLMSRESPWGGPGGFLPLKSSFGRQGGLTRAVNPLCGYPWPGPIGGIAAKGPPVGGCDDAQNWAPGSLDELSGRARRVGPRVIEALGNEHAI
jgi:hypothetical protein